MFSPAFWWCSYQSVGAGVGSVVGAVVVGATVGVGIRRQTAVSRALPEFLPACGAAAAVARLEESAVSNPGN